MFHDIKLFFIFFLSLKKGKIKVRLDMDLSLHTSTKLYGIWMGFIVFEYVICLSIFLPIIYPFSITYPYVNYFLTIYSSTSHLFIHLSFTYLSTDLLFFYLNSLEFHLSVVFPLTPHHLSSTHLSTDLRSN